MSTHQTHGETKIDKVFEQNILHLLGLVFLIVVIKFQTCNNTFITVWFEQT